ncbi:transcription regulator of the Arc/MetJ class [Rhizobium leguminosarum bv. trifolii WSM2297]|uniref:Transcription regulator of the Arc/MetJ class n=1 Tax=Rhizobium leguminosarum bv. trifolii WSM2297 TaxID=754762 RepID=J0CHD4_RHILT|nr:transcription regulator of the Arc/MetJ class [Rhizobium leguminosarum bv. trifolii WSM2297]
MYLHDIGTLEVVMRTTIDIDDDLIDAAMIVTGSATKEAAVEQALRILIERHRRKNAIADLAGADWEGDLDEIRCDQPDDKR